VSLLVVLQKHFSDQQIVVDCVALSANFYYFLQHNLCLEGDDLQNQNRRAVAWLGGCSEHSTHLD
jgi:hypothetical protein